MCRARTSWQRRATCSLRFCKGAAALALSNPFVAVWWFDKEVQRAHGRLRQTIPSYIREGSVLSLLSAPVIYLLLIPLTLLGAWVWAYQWICFPIYGIARVRRGEYFVMDRRRLAYLNGIGKV